jgi:hypothetical protein
MRRYEAGDMECNYTRLVALADLYDVSIDYLLGRCDDTGVVPPGDTGDS